MRVVVAGGTGLVGRALVVRLRAEGHEALVVTRGPVTNSRLLGWEHVAEGVDGADAVVNLAGESVGGGRWTRAKKARILGSRVETTTRLVDAIAGAAAPPRVFVVASGIDWSGDSGEAVVDEDAAPGDSFLAHVCRAWEAAAARSPVRWVAVRTPLVVARDAAALKLMALPFRLGLGGRLGSGRQWFPWIHIDDLVDVFCDAIRNESLHGPVNAVAPEQLRQRDVARELANVLHRPALLPAPATALRALLGEQADLLLHGQRAVSSRLNGKPFRYPALRAALEDALA